MNLSKLEDISSEGVSENGTITLRRTLTTRGLAVTISILSNIEYRSERWPRR